MLCVFASLHSMLCVAFVIKCYNKTFPDSWILIFFLFQTQLTHFPYLDATTCACATLLATVAIMSAQCKWKVCWIGRGSHLVLYSSPSIPQMKQVDFVLLLKSRCCADILGDNWQLCWYSSYVQHYKSFTKLFKLQFCNSLNTL